MSFKVLVGVVMLFVLVNAQNPGLVARFKFDSFAAVLKSVLGGDFNSVMNQESKRVFNFNPINGRNYRIFNLRLRSHDAGDSGMQALTAERLRFFVNGARFVFKADWSGTVSEPENAPSWLQRRRRVKGELNLLALGFRMNIIIKLGRGPQGKLTWTEQSCDSAIRTVFVQPTRYSRLLRRGIDNLQSFLRRKFQTQICSSIGPALERQLRSMTSTYPLLSPIGFHTSVNLALVRPPTVDSSKIELAMKGLCFSNVNNPSQTIPFKPPSMPSLSDTDKMIEISIGEYFLNTFIYSIWQNGFFTQTFSQTQVGDHETLRETRHANFHFTSTEGLFLCQVNKVVGTKEGNAVRNSIRGRFRSVSDRSRPLMYSASAPTTPSFVINASGLSFTFKGYQAVVNVQTANGKLKPMGTVSLDGKFTGEINIVNDVISLRPTGTNVVATSSNGLPTKEFRRFAVNYMQRVVFRNIGRILFGDEMILFPIAKGARLVNPTVVYKENTMEITGNLGPA